MVWDVLADSAMTLGQAILLGWEFVLCFRFYDWLGGQVGLWEARPWKAPWKKN